MPGVADCFDLAERVEPVGLRHLYGKRRELLRDSAGRQDQQQAEDQKVLDPGKSVQNCQQQPSAPLRGGLLSQRVRSPVDAAATAYCGGADQALSAASGFAGRVELLHFRLLAPEFLVDRLNVIRALGAQ